MLYGVDNAPECRENFLAALEGFQMDERDSHQQEIPKASCLFQGTILRLDSSIAYENPWQQVNIKQEKQNAAAVDERHW